MAGSSVALKFPIEAAINMDRLAILSRHLVNEGAAQVGRHCTDDVYSRRCVGTWSRMRSSSTMKASILIRPEKELGLGRENVLYK